MSLFGEDPKGSGNNNIVLTHNANLLAFSPPAAAPSSSAGPPAISCLDGYRQNVLVDGISEQTSELRLSYSWRKGMAGAYNSAWKQWNSWCGQRKIDPFCSIVASVADYLT